MLGGGGYTIQNVAQCWAYETNILLKENIPNEILYNGYFENYSPEFKLHLQYEVRDTLYQQEILSVELFFSLNYPMFERG